MLYFAYRPMLCASKQPMLTSVVAFPSMREQFAKATIAQYVCFRAVDAQRVSALPK